jgi:hypothetical protein
MSERKDQSDKHSGSEADADEKTVMGSTTRHYMVFRKDMSADEIDDAIRAMSEKLGIFK